MAVVATFRRLPTPFFVKNIEATSRISASFSTAIRHVNDDKDIEKQKSKRLIIKPKHRRPIIQKQRERNTQLDEKAQALSKSWRYLGATYTSLYCDYFIVSLYHYITEYCIVTQ